MKWRAGPAALAAGALALAGTACEADEDIDADDLPEVDVENGEFPPEDEPDS